MTFQVIGPDGKGKMITHSEKCLPSKSDIQSMAKCGYKFKVDGKNASKSAVLELIDKTNKPKSVKTEMPWESDGKLF